MPEDEKAVAENLLTYHPSVEDKIGCGVDAIMVNNLIDHCVVVKLL